MLHHPVVWVLEDQVTDIAFALAVSVSCCYRFEKVVDDLMALIPYKIDPLKEY